MDIFDIVILEPPSSSFNFTLDNTLISLLIFAIASLITLVIALYYRKIIAICTLNYIAALLKYEKITYKDFAYLIAKILCYRHKASNISREEPPKKSSKGKHYLWIALIDTLNEVRYNKEKPSEKSHSKLYKTTLEWLRYS